MIKYYFKISYKINYIMEISNQDFIISSLINNFSKDNNNIIKILFNDVFQESNLKIFQKIYFKESNGSLECKYQMKRN